MNDDEHERVAGVDFDWRNPFSASKLSRAVREKKLTNVRRLINQGVALDTPDNRGFTPLHEAAKDDGCVELARLLIRAGAYISHETVERETPLFVACASSSEAMVKLLLTHKCPVNAPNIDGMTPLHIACTKSNTNIIRNLIAAGADVNKRDSTCRTPIYLAIEQANAVATKMLLEAGADTQVTDFYSRTPLQIACSVNNTEVFDILIDHLGLSKDLINYQTEDGWTLLMEAVQFKNYKIAEKLISYGADTSLIDNRGLLALHIAAHCEQFNCLVLIINNTPIDCIEKYSTYKQDLTHTRSLPCLLIDRNMYEGLELLLNYGLSKDVISCPAKMGDYLVSPVSFLLLHGSNVEPKDKMKYLDLLLSYQDLIDPYYKTVYEVVSTLEAAVKMHHPSDNDCICLNVLNQLLEKGADPDSDWNGDNSIPELFVKVLEMGYIPALKLLLKYSKKVEPEGLMVYFFTKITMGSLVNTYFWLGNELLLTDFFLKTCSDMSPAYDMMCNTLQPHNCTTYYTRVWPLSEAIKHGRQIPSLKRLARTTIRKQLHKDSETGQLLDSIKKLNIPKLITNFLTYEDL